jgi:hypothetical protein
MNRKTTRRDLLLGTTLAGGTMLLPGLVRSALAQTPTNPKLAIDRNLVRLQRDQLRALPPLKIRPPVAAFVRASAGQGIAGPWGEVQVVRSREGIAVPSFVRSADGRAIAEFAVRRPVVRIGVGTADTVAFTSAGVSFDARGTVEPWNGATIRRLVKTLVASPESASALLQVRASLASAYPVALLQMRATDMPPKLADVYRNLAKSLAQPRSKCTTTEVVDTVTTTVERTVQIWRSAEEQYESCISKETSGRAGLACSLAPAGPARDACAIPICIGFGFVDVLVGMMTVIEQVTEEVTRLVTVCASSGGRILHNRWKLIERQLPSRLPGTSLAAAPAAIGAADIAAALEFLKDATGAFGAFTACMLDGRWSLAALETPIQLADLSLSVAYGVNVCLDADCARTLTAQNMLAELASSWTAALTLLAALSKDFAAFGATIGIKVSAELAAAVATLGGLGTAATAAAALILAVIVLGLIYATAIAAQLSVHLAIGSFADGTVCITHPTFALGMIKILSFAQVPAELVPPIVTG